MLELKADIEGLTVNGIDIICWKDKGKMGDFEVMIEPFKAIDLVHQRIAAMFAAKENNSS